MRVRTVVTVLGVVIAAVVVSAPAQATAYSADLTCRTPDRVGSDVRLPQVVHVGDTIDVHYHNCVWLFLNGGTALASPDIGLADYPPPGWTLRPYLLPASDGVVTLVAVTEPIGGDYLVELLAGPGDQNGASVSNPFRPAPKFKVIARRDARKCTTITVTLQGIPASANLEVQPSLKFNGHWAGTRYDGTGGTGDSWSHTFSFAHASNYPIPKGPVQLGVSLGGPYLEGVDYRNDPVEGWTRVAACR